MKDIYGVALTDSTEKHRRYVVSRRVVTLARIKDGMTEATGGSLKRKGHISGPAHADVMCFAKELHGVYRHISGRGKNNRKVPNIFDKGLEKLADRKIWDRVLDMGQGSEKFTP
ncbi:hypothetical protein TWF730_002657 [Orbilia blumenaviensis]|uniref:Uncharacterized protein n=1 Tax=Orbilia blumenaviensis TaxID=1796055 RepID=A0AAV9UB82_9PEZI